MSFLYTHRLPIALLVVALGATGLAVWLSLTTPEPTAITTATSTAEAPRLVSVHQEQAVAEVPGLQVTPPAQAAAQPLPESEPAASADIPEDWLDPYYGLTRPGDREAVTALTNLAETLDFDRFWPAILPLAEQGNDFAVYLILTLRDFMPLSAEALRYGYVEEPYLEQNRRAFRSPNWLHWLYAHWQPDWQPTEEQKSEALARALAGHRGAQTLLVSQSQWFTAQPEMASRMDELLDRLPSNPWLQLYNLSQLSNRVLEAAPEDDAMEHLLAQLKGARHPLSQWLGYALVPERSTQEQRRSGLLSLAQDGYLTALQEVRLLATSGIGRWTDETATPVSLRDAVVVYQQQEAQHPDNPLVSVTLCELHWHRGDYQASWQYLQKFAYQDAWADEVEDYTCVPSGPRAYGETLVARGVITAPQWQEHMDTIAARRARIRNTGR